MKVVIQCAGRKQPHAGSLRTRTGQRVKFVAHPEQAPSSTEWLYAHPDGPSDVPAQTWRQQLVAYNANPHDNPLGLLEAYRLYRNSLYQELVDAFGLTNVFVLSAAWGLVRADYLLPYYDLTFAQTQPGDSYKRRMMRWDKYDDFSQLSNEEDGPLVYFGGNNYLPLFKKVTGHVHCEKVIFFAAANPPSDAQWRTVRFERNFYNWHYACARDFIAAALNNKRRRCGELRTSVPNYMNGQIRCLPCAFHSMTPRSP